MLLTIDIGIKHLSLCIMKATDKTDLKTYEIQLWDVYNTLEDTTKYCNSHTKSGSICNKICKYVCNETFYCKTHFPKDIPIKKNNNYKEKVIKDYPLQEIARSVLNKLNEIYEINKEIFSQITDIFIELQPTFNPSMKLISHVIYGKLVELLSNCNIKFVRASQKLKIKYDGPELVCNLKGKYAQRKWMSIQIVKYILENKFSQEQSNKWLPKFIEQGTADEGDTFLMAINGLYGIPKKEVKSKAKPKVVKTKKEPKRK